MFAVANVVMKFVDVVDNTVAYIVPVLLFVITDVLFKRKAELRLEGRVDKAVIYGIELVSDVILFQTFKTEVIWMVAEVLSREVISRESKQKYSDYNQALFTSTTTLTTCFDCLFFRVISER